MITAETYAGMRGAAATRISARYGKLLRKMLWKSLDAGIADFREIAALKSLAALSLTIIAAEGKESSLKMPDIHELVLAGYIIALVSLCVLTVLLSAVIVIKELAPRKEKHDRSEYGEGAGKLR